MTRKRVNIIHNMFLLTAQMEISALSATTATTTATPKQTNKQNWKQETDKRKIALGLQCNFHKFVTAISND